MHVPARLGRDVGVQSTRKPTTAQLTHTGILCNSHGVYTFHAAYEWRIMTERGGGNLVVVCVNREPVFSNTNKRCAVCMSLSVYLSPIFWQAPIYSYFQSDRKTEVIPVWGDGILNDF